MSVIPLVRASAISPLVRYLDQMGVPSERFLRQAKLPVMALDDPVALIPLHRAFAFAESAAQQEGIELFGLLAAQKAQVDDFGLFAKVACQSLTLYDFLHTVAILLTKTHNSGARAWVTQTNDRVWFNHQYIQSESLNNQQAQYYACCLYVQIIQQVVGTEWHPTDLHFQARQLRGLEDIELFSQARVHFNQPNNAIGFAKALLSLPIKQSIEAHPSSLQQDYETLVTLAPKTDFVGSLKQLVRSHLPDGGLPVTLAAETAGLSTRSLQRRLAEDGLSYSRLIDQVRFRLALDLLKDPFINSQNLLSLALNIKPTMSKP
ncbi:AraC family transcriptional regulator ligand-binding domain-containing protein [Phormidium sp. LEGE 05292]|uniref:AraC family transcriptional regulator ligand-binding domain-containing protein n=1 Tax=[Phormidium] sp. LEGE 05292 TaxID=767427 RepID=UPI00188303B1|nr:AraC family transcriptional regulator ligand-binding domain-containing protein [Phormidium sp. LEGE 05292]MBE9225499.1 AraC family transcriptional regulator ligand-binding domain-containing protein [Phormidium sp. LEGE 05292]